MQPELQTMENSYYGRGTAISQNRVLRNTYLLLALSMIPTVIGAALGTNINLSFMRTSPVISFFAVLAIFYGWIFMIEKNRNSVAGVWLLLGFTLFLGLLLGPLLQRVLGLPNGTGLVMMAAGGTAIIFAVMAGVANTIKRSLTGLGNFLMVGGIVLMLAMVANLFFQSPVVYLVIVGAFLIFSSLMILWQINNIVTGGETNYISATLSLYISIYNIFTSLLQILGIGGSSD